MIKINFEKEGSINDRELAFITLANACGKVLANRNLYPEDIKILKRANFKTDEIIDHIKNFRDYSSDNTEEYKKEIDKLMEGLK